MPELPEAENFTRAINQKFSGKTIKKLYVRNHKLRYDIDVKTLQKIFQNHTKFLHAKRVGKQIELYTENGVVSVSLGMTGAFFEGKAQKPELHEHVTLVFTDGTALSYKDPRRFGFWLCHKAQVKGVDPLSTQELKKAFAHYKNAHCSIKSLLMNQNVIAGLGNIYALEALFLAKTHPCKPCYKLEKKQWESLAQNIPKLLQRAIDRGGSSVATYAQFSGKKGNFQQEHAVYKREHCPCPVCATPIMRIVQSGRSSWFCPRCQT